MNKLTGAHIVIVGGGSGIGLAAAQEALERGARVTIVGRSKDKLDQANEQLKGTLRVYQADVLQEDSLKKAFKEIGHFNHLFVSAAAGVTAPLANSSIHKLRPTLDIKIWGALLCAKHAAQYISPGGSVTFISGLAGRRGYAGFAIAGAANAGGEALARNLAIELAPIRFNTVCAGVIDTAMLDAVFGSEKKKIVAEISKKLPVGRIGKALEIADAVLFVMGNSFINGSTLLVDGGDALV